MAHLLKMHWHFFNLHCPNFCDVHAYLEDGEQVTEVQKAIFHRLKMQTASLVDIQSALLVIMRMMWAYYGKKLFCYWMNTMCRCQSQQ